jgi:hypothetical protein
MRRARLSIEEALSMLSNALTQIEGAAKLLSGVDGSPGSGVGLWAELEATAGGVREVRRALRRDGDTLQLQAEALEASERVERYGFRWGGWVKGSGWCAWRAGTGLETHDIFAPSPKELLEKLQHLSQEANAP